jgi:hypothetical protein
MEVIYERNLYHALPVMAKGLIDCGYDAGEDVFRAMDPITIQVDYPKERVMFYRSAEFNPFSFLAGALHIILVNAKGIKDFGKSLREDRVGTPHQIQIGNAYTIFQRNEDRNLAAHMYSLNPDPVQDLIVISVIQELLANLADCGVGGAWWTSSNVHVIKTRALQHFEKLAAEKTKEFYHGEPYPIKSVSSKHWFNDLAVYNKLQHRGNYKDLFFSSVVSPLIQAGVALQNRAYGLAQQKIAGCVATDWKKAADDFIIRRSLEDGQN